MTAPTPPTGTQLTTASYTLTNGVYTKTFGSITVNFTISDEPDTGTVTVVANGDVSATDIANAAASLTSFGYNMTGVPLGAAGGQTFYGQSL